MLMRELTNSFLVISDNERMFPRPANGSPRGHESPAEKLDALGSVWEIAKTLALLPSYLAARIDVLILPPYYRTRPIRNVAPDGALGRQLEAA